MSDQLWATRQRAGGRVHRSPMVLVITAMAVALTILAGGCTKATSGSAGLTPATIASGLPWLGTFSAAALPTPVNSLTNLDCVTAKFCWAVGSTIGGANAPNGAAVITTANGGATWHSQIIPTTVGYLSGISCSDRHYCIAVGQATQTSNGQAVIIATTTGGTGWTAMPVPAGVLDLTAVTCRADRHCLAVGTGAGGVTALISTSPTSSWVPGGRLPANLNGATDVACSDDQHCWVTAHTSVDADHIAGAVALTTDGGSTWAAVVTPPGIGYLNGVSCLNGPDDGAGALPVPSSIPAPTTTAVPPTTTSTAPPVASTTTTIPVVGVAGVRCTIVGTTETTLNGARSGHGVVLTSTNGGATWSRQKVAPATAALLDVSCPSIGSCVAVGNSVAASAQAGVAVLTGSVGHPWKQAAVIGFPQPLSAVSCVSDSNCVTVGESISEHLT